LFVQFQVGRMRELSGGLQRVRGSTLMVTVDPAATAAAILDIAVQKHRACDWTVIDTQYDLLYPDGQLVQCLPGTQEPFTLSGYKNFMGKAYQKLILFLCAHEDYTAGK